MRTAILIIIALILVGCGRNRELAGTSVRLMPDQLAWLEGVIEADVAEAPIPAGTRVIAGRILVRADGEVISGRPLMLAALRGAASAGATIIDEGGQDAAMLIKGEINVQAYQQERASVSRYTCELQLVRQADRSVVWSQSWIIANTHEQQRWK